MFISKENYDNLTFNELLELIKEFNESDIDPHKKIKVESTLNESARVSLSVDKSIRISKTITSSNFKEPIHSIYSWFLTDKELQEELKNDPNVQFKDGDIIFK